jgi:hypothetical protein
MSRLAPELVFNQLVKMTMPKGGRFWRALPASAPAVVK